MTDRPFLSIGEVLDLLKVDFPDVTISKIRFLEGQGLVDPERTPSGYRKFHERDVERLRWILRQQRDHFLPLKVIKDRLERDGGGPSAVRDVRPGGGGSSADAAPETGSFPAAGRHERPLPPGDGDRGEPRGASGDVSTTVSSAGGARLGSDLGMLVSGLSSATFTRAELASAGGLDDAALSELERYGLVKARTAGGATWFDEEALIVARVAASFARHGVEARHLRMFKTAAEREASLFEQVVLPLARQRDPVAKRRSIEALADLVRLGEGLRGSMLRQALRAHTEGA